MSTYKDIIKSTWVIGLVQVIKLVFGFVQNKVLALVVGPGGFGIWSLYNSFIVMISSFSSIGIDQAGVRQIAINADDNDKIKNTIWVFKKSILFFSFLFSIIVFISSEYLSFKLFGDISYSLGLRIVSFSVLLNSLTQSNYSILNGLRKIKKLALSQILGVIFTTIVSILFISIYKERGIPYFIILSSIALFLISSYFVDKEGFLIFKLEKLSFFSEFLGLIKLGVGITYSAIIVAISTTLIQVYLRSNFGLEVLGYYNASFTLSNIYIGVILSAMGVDFMPRLSKIIDNPVKVNSLIEQQLNLGLIAASFGVCFVIFLAKDLIQLLYSKDFLDGISILKWQILGVFMRVISFPLGYYLIVNKMTLKYVIVQSVLWFGNYSLLVVFTKLFGYNVIGLNYLISYCLYLFILIKFTRKSLNFTKQTFYIFCKALAFVVLIMMISFIEIYFIRLLLGTISLLLNIYWIKNSLNRIMGINIVEIIKSKFC